MKRIVCGYDGSEHADRAVDLAAELAGKYRATLALVFVVEPYVPPMDVPAVAQVDVIGPLRDAGQKMLARAAERIRTATGITPEVEVRVGSPPHELVESATQRAADFMVVGSRGLGAVKRLLLGSVADRVTHLATSPVLVVR